MNTDFEKVIEEAKAEILPFESWERLTGETPLAFAAFCAFRDMGAERNIRKAVETVEPDEAVRAKRYNVWRNWAAQFRWRERAADMRCRSHAKKVLGVNYLLFGIMMLIISFL